jgi:hypothetical protein
MVTIECRPQGSSPAVNAGSGSDGETKASPRRNRRSGLCRLARSLPGTVPLFLALLLTPAGAEPPTLSVRVRRVLLPLVTEEALDQGGLATDAARGTSAFEVEVTAPEGGAGWVLYVRADGPTFTADGAGKPCTDLMWKLDQANAADYRALDDHEMVVLENPAGGSARIALDVRVGLDWRTNPGAYGLGLIFRVAPY